MAGKSLIDRCFTEDEDEDDGELKSNDSGRKKTEKENSPHSACKIFILNIEITKLIEILRHSFSHFSVSQD